MLFGVGVDLHAVTSFRRATTREHLVLAPGEQLLAGGTWVFSEPQPGVTGLVDVTGMDWPTVEDLPGGGLRVGATCTIAELAALPPRPGWTAHPLFAQCAGALLASPKIWEQATVGGNVCRAYAAAGMVTLGAALDAVAEIWAADGSDHETAVERLATGDGENCLAAGDVLRAVRFPSGPLRARTAFRKLALSDLGRSAAVCTGRVDDDGSAVLTVTAATAAPTVLRFASLPTVGEVDRALDDVDGWYTDPLGPADWREHVSRVLLAEIIEELGGSA